jgi:ABC-type cobalamin transport system permease subunit
MSGIISRDVVGHTIGSAVAFAVAILIERFTGQAVLGWAIGGALLATSVWLFFTKRGNRTATRLIAGVVVTAGFLALWTYLVSGAA